MKRLMMFVAISLLLIGFVAATIDITPSITSGAIKNQSQIGLTSEDNESENTALITASNANEERERLKEVIKERNRIKVTTRAWECPTECTCTGSTIKCQLANGREMTIIAGNSGNMMVQVKGENMSTNVTLYQSGGKLYGVFRNNETKVVRMLPDQVKERIRERTRAMLQNETISLNENGNYEYQAEKRARLFFIFPVRMMVSAEIDAETGEVVKVSKPKWWAFLARDEEQFVLGESCGTVTPGENDNCCKNKGYDVWDAETQQCDFAE